MNKEGGVPSSVTGVVTSTCRADLLLFTGETDVLEGAGLDEPMAKLLTVFLLRRGMLPLIGNQLARN